LTLRERLLQLNETVTGHRLLRGGVHYGGATLLKLPRVDELNEIARAFHELVDLARANNIVMDRFTGTGVLSAEQAARSACSASSLERRRSTTTLG